MEPAEFDRRLGEFASLIARAAGADLEPEGARARFLAAIAAACKASGLRLAAYDARPKGAAGGG